MKQTNDHKGTVHKLTEEEIRKLDTAKRPRRPAWMPQDCADTPTRYLCRCFAQAARDAVETASASAGRPPQPLKNISFVYSTERFSVRELLGRMLDELTFQSHNETFSGPANTIDLLCAFFDFLEYSVPYLEKRHTDADGKGGERVAAAVTKIIEGVDGSEMALAVPPAEFSRRVVALLDLDAEEDGKDLDSRLSAIAKNSAIAAAKTKLELEVAAQRGRASAKTRKAEAGGDPVRKTIISEVNKLKRERAKMYPHRDTGGEKGPSNNQIYRNVARRHVDANGKPIYDAQTIKEWFKPSKVERRGGHVRRKTK